MKFVVYSTSLKMYVCSPKAWAKMPQDATRFTSQKAAENFLKNNFLKYHPESSLVEMVVLEDTDLGFDDNACRYTPDSASAALAALDSTLKTIMDDYPLYAGLKKYYSFNDEIETPPTSESGAGDAP